MCKCGLPQGALVILLFVLLVHFAPIYHGITPALRASAIHPHDAVFATVGVGISLLLYPVFGLLADLVYSRYKLIVAGCLVICASVSAFNIDINYSNQLFVLAIGTVLIAIVLGSFGMIQANILQFGMDQLMEASCDKLIKFVHWYYWVTKLS